MFLLDGKVYFGWPTPPWVGVVYEVEPEAVDYGHVVQLPDGKELLLHWEENDWLEVAETSTPNRSDAKVHHAIRIFDNDEDGPTFEGDWQPMLKLINIASAVNALFVVYLPLQEYKRLAANKEAEFEILKRRLTERAASLVRLEEDYYDSGVPVVWLLRTGHCS